MVFVLDKSKKPLDMISHAKARILLKNKQAVVHKIYPFTIRLKDNSCVNNNRSYTVKIDPGSRTTGVAIVDDKSSVVMLAEIGHRGHVIKRNLEIENVSFNVAQMTAGANLVGTAYQQGPLYQTKLRSYLFKKYNGQCVYCGAKATEIDHIIPKSSGGTNSIHNLVASCRSCNQMKSNKTLKEFGKIMNKNYSHLEPKKLPKDAAIVQSARNYMVREVTKLVSDTTTHPSWLTKYNRDQLGLSKQHYYDALSVGEIPNKFNFLTDKVLQISAKGRGSRQMCRVDRYGFPVASAKTSKSVKGFQTGDIVKAIALKGSKQGEYLGRVIVRSRGSFYIRINNGLTKEIRYKYCHLIQRGDGYSYKYKECDSTSAINNRVSIADL